MPLKFTDEQREAISCAVLDDNHTVLQAVRAAASGEFGPAFTISPSTAYTIVADERERRRPPGDVADIIADVRHRMLQRCDLELARLEKLAELNPDDVRALRDLSKVVRQVSELTCSGRDGDTAGDPEDAEGQPPSTSFASRIAARAAAVE